jgi:cysteine desulfurase
MTHTSSHYSGALPLYLDHAATTPLDAGVFAEMLPHFTRLSCGNPSSLHQLGREARQTLNQCKLTIANCLGVTPHEIYFTSGATEANNWLIQGLCQARQSAGNHVITTGIEHAAVQKPLEYLEKHGYEVTWLPVDAEGFVNERLLQQSIRPDTILVSVIHGHNEIGTLQPVDRIGAFLQAKNIPFHIDAVQTIGKLPLDLKTLPVDYAAMSAHKFYGPKGIGALYIRNGSVVPEPLLYGGGQEDNLRSGTENIAGIVGFAKALQQATCFSEENGALLRELQAYFIGKVLAAIPEAILNGPQDLSRRVPGNVHFSFPPGEGEAMVLQLDLKGIAVSSGSACHSAIIEPSRIIRALGKSDEVARATLRFSFGHSTTRAMLDYTVDTLARVVARQRKKQIG